MVDGKKIYGNIQRLAYAQERTVNDVCRKAKVSAGVISDLKNGRRNSIGKITIDKLSKELDCQAEDIMFGKSDPSQLPESPKAMRTEAFIDRAVEALRDRAELRRLVRAAMKANTQQVKSTAILLESITQAQQEGLFGIHDEQ